MDLGLTDRVYVMTGASRGLGLATARVAVAEGARVVLVARPSDALDAARDELGAAAAILPGDLAEEGVSRRAVSIAMDEFGRIDGALLSVGGPPPGSVLTTTDEQWRSAFESVFLGCVRAARDVVDGIVAAGTQEQGAIAWVLSTSAVEPITGLTSSNGLRPGLAMLVKDLSNEVGPTGIRVNGLMPSRVATDRLKIIDANSEDAAAQRARIEALIPLRRYGTPEEFGRVATFVLSPAASYVTGTLIAVDGGMKRQP